MMTPQTNSTRICGQQEVKEAPSKATLRTASLKAVNGKNLIMGCRKAGNAVFGKKVGIDRNYILIFRNATNKKAKPKKYQKCNKTKNEHIQERNPTFCKMKTI